MINGADITNVAGIYIDTSGMNTHNFVVHQGRYDVNMPQSNLFFNGSANGSNIKNASLISNKDFAGGMIESILGVGSTFLALMDTFQRAVFSIHTLAAPYFGDTNSWVLEGMVDTILAIGLFQIVSGRSFKTME
jgi:hypothetical protein